jgi:GTP-binding protein LepA
VICGIKNLKEVQVGDTITSNKLGAEKPLEGFKKVKPMVFSGIFPIETPQYKDLQEALEKLCLNDSSLSFEVESSAALGFGFRCGFLGLLHMEIVQERLEREFGLDLITTAPTVVHHVYRTNGEMEIIENPSQFEVDSNIERIEEPYVRLALHTPSESVGSLLKLCETRRGVQEKMEYIAADKVVITYQLPLSEMVFDFYDKLKSVSKGYASMEYELIGYQASDLQKMDVLINNDPVDALSIIVHKSKAQSRVRILTKKLKELIPRQQFQVNIQAAVGAKILARETLGALRKDVTAKCYGGDITRKRKLLEKQKEGKKRMKQIGKIDIPQKAFLAVLSTDD